MPHRHTQTADEIEDAPMIGFALQLEPIEERRQRLESVLYWAGWVILGAVGVALLRELL